MSFDIHASPVSAPAPISAPLPEPAVTPAAPSPAPAQPLEVADGFDAPPVERTAGPKTEAEPGVTPLPRPELAALQSARGHDGFDPSPVQHAVRASQSPAGRAAAERLREDTAARTQTLGEAFGSRSVTEHAGQFALGFRDGVRDTAGGLIESARLVGRFATDSQFRTDVMNGVAELREVMRTDEGRRAIGEVMGAGADRLIAEISQNPARAAGFVAGSLATGGALTRALSTVGRLGAVQRLAQQSREFVSANRGPLIAGGVAGGAALVAADPTLVADVARTAAQAPYASTVVAGSLASSQGRLLGAGLREHARHQLRELQKPSEAPPVEGSTWIFAP